ncbi:hypothetical protein FH972_008209 [Carpinus fangiana]|uniref:Uncharacterized protein n=1 Tax=Carpinus fangiana TaxID=176857 RepID=A0A5N6QXZ4_9ROSI|nr:hypothetical protein FH972_008209 [Carpinus fangiana]
MNPNPVDMNPNSNSIILNPKDESGGTSLNANVMNSNSGSTILNQGAQSRQKLEVKMRQRDLDVKWLDGTVRSLGQGIDSFFIEEEGGKLIITMEGGILDTYEIVLKLHQICGGVDLCSFSCSDSSFTNCLTYIDLGDMEELKAIMSFSTGRKYRKNRKN